MDKFEIGYKVICVVAGEYYSAAYHHFIHKSIAHVYKFKKWTRPKEGFGPLAVFGDEPSCRMFMIRNLTPLYTRVTGGCVFHAIYDIWKVEYVPSHVEELSLVVGANAPQYTEIVGAFPYYEYEGVCEAGKGQVDHICRSRGVTGTKYASAVRLVEHCNRYRMKKPVVFEKILRA